MTTFDLSRNQIMTLELAEIEPDGITQADVEDLCRISLADAGDVLAILAEHELLERVQHEHRRRRFTLTEKGLEIVVADLSRRLALFGESEAGHFKRIIREGSGEVPDLLRGRKAIGFVRVADGGSAEDREILASVRSGELSGLVEDAGLTLVRVIVEEGSHPMRASIRDRHQVAAVIEAIRNGEASVVATRGPAHVAHELGELTWFATEVAAAGGLWWQGGGAILPPAQLP